MIGISIANSLGFTGPSVLPDASSQAYFAATGITGATQQAAIDNLVKGLKADGLWSKMKAVYPFVTDNRNLLSYTEDFSNGYWQKQNTSAITNATIAPNGTLTADKLNENGVNGYHSFSFPVGVITTTNPYTCSFYAKAAERTWCSVYLYDGTLYEAFFDLVNGVVGSVASGMTATITNVDNGWYRCTVTRSVTITTSTNGGIISAIGNNQSSYTGTSGSGVYVWGAQLELGSTATTYQPIATTQQAYIAAQFKYNLVNPVDSDAAFRLVFNGGWTHSSNGAIPNGTNGYADTKLNVNSTLTLISNHLSIYSRTSSPAAFKTDIGVTATNHFRLRLLESISTGWALISTVPTWALSTSVANSLGFYLGSRTSNNKLIFQKNSTILSTSTVNETNNLPNAVCYLGALNNSGALAEYSDRQIAFSTIGDGLLDAEASALYTHVQNFQLALNRAV